MKKRLTRLLATLLFSTLGATVVAAEMQLPEDSSQSSPPNSAAEGADC